MALWCEQAWLPDGWCGHVRLTLEQGRISGIETGIDAAPGDERHAIFLPGLPNLHSHAFQRGMAGLAERAGTGADSFWTWREAMYHFVDRLDPEGMQAIAALAFAEMLESGFTCVGEFHYLHHGLDGQPYDDIAIMARAIADAADATGIALTLLPVFYAHAGFGGADPAPGQRRFVNDVDRYARLLDAAQGAVAGLDAAVVGVAPHSLRAATAEELAAVAAMAPGAPVHIHIAEQTAEVDACLAWSGARPVEWLMDHADVDRDWCLVHATHITDAERHAIVQSGAVAGLCPITEANLGDGLFPARDFLAEGGRFGVGSDSNVEIDAAAELRLLEYGQRLAQRGRNLLASGAGQSTGASLYRGALAGGGQALGRPSPGLAVGAAADIVSLNAADPGFAGRTGDAILDSWIFGGGARRVDCVWRGGVKRVAGGRHVARDAIDARYRTAMATLLG
ncbi:formimidoylglutamate deiminase [Sphingopyxis lindanitolerans]|uniref:Formimidoylglutamate deiminase n=1 Tax=Sphingopyxis lindanitolerans TaxID=2054227 RepID=A0A2S8B1U5_9SPHN|nr:formimidoylglutamate deiminase [Sphingopyxis lindanitolerans]PQM26278.1 formimidoylglutamate deiminase [Sphingopyxis lindanitolerans]